MEQVEEKAVVISLDGNLATVAAQGQQGCGACSSSSACGTSVLSSLFSSKQRLLVVRNSIAASPGDEVTIAINRMALIIASLLVYLVPVIMLILGAILGESLANATGLEDGEIASIILGTGFSVVAFLITRRVLRSAFFSYFFDPVLLDRK